ncbi:(2Fe-2S)-binding protein, partial [bacterium]|nr:(2Fe-2S)-binding protein [bacterium]
MALVTISLDGKEVRVEHGITILEAARQNGIEIPTLCHDEQLEPFTSCWVCAVKLEGMKRYIPSCGTRVVEGMKVWTNTEDVRAVRRMALELLMSNHRGDCIAPCQVACPASVDVQGYITLIAKKKYRDATKLVKEVNPFPLSIGRVCTRPCEDECRRNAMEGPVCIDFLKRFAADWDIEHE